MKGHYSYLLASFFFFISIQNYAQCDEIYQPNYHAQSPITSVVPLAGQTFIATCTGTFNQLTIRAGIISGDPNLPVELKIYKDFFGSNPVLLQEINEPLPPIVGNRFRTFSIDVDVEAGETYAWVLKRNLDVNILLHKAPGFSGDPDLYTDGRGFVERADDPGNYVKIPGNTFNADWHFNLVYLDETAPVAICQDISKNLGSGNTVTILPSEIDNGSYDAQSGIVSYTLSQDTFDCSNVGDNLVTLTIEDAGGNIDSCQATVTIVDTVSPTLTCPADITVTTVPGTPTIVTYDDIIATEECALTPPSGFSYLGNWNGSSYYLSNFITFGQSAFLAAESLNGHLATVTSQEQNDGLANALNGTRALIGYTDRAVEGNFEWHSGATSTYSNWNLANGSPNGGDLEDYVQINDSGTWDDQPSTVPQRFILELPNPIIQTAGLPSGSEFPIGETTNSFQITDASGNVGTCSFTVTVEQAPETEIELSFGKLFVRDIGEDSDDHWIFTQSNDGSTMTISNLTAPVTVSSGVTVVDATTVSIPMANITNDILVYLELTESGIYSDSMTITNGLNLTGTTNDLSISGVTNFTQTGTMNIDGSVFITGNTGGTISLAEMNVQGLMQITDISNIVNTAGPIAIAGTTNLQSQTSINLNEGSFGGAITLESETIDFRATSGDLTFNTVTATGTDVTNNNYLYAAGDINFTNTVQTAGDSNLTIRGNIVQQSSSGIITTNELVLEGNSFDTSAFVLDQAMNDVNKITSNTTNHLTSGLLLNDIDDVEIGVVNTGAIYADANTFTFSDSSNLTLVFDSVLDGTMDLTATNHSTPSQINHNGGTLTLRGASSYAFTGAFQYMAVAGATLQITNAEVLIDTPDHIQTFGRLHMLFKPFTVAAGSTINILDVGEFRLNGASLQGDGIINGTIELSSSATLKPGTETTTGHLTINGDIKLFSTSTNTNTFPSFAPLIESDTSFDTVNLSGTLDLEDAKFEPKGDFTNANNTQEIILINNDGTDPIIGTFEGIEEGDVIVFPNSITTLSYVGGDGNDISLSVETTDAFVTTWKTDHNGASNDNQVSIYTDHSLTYNYTVDWGDGTIQSGITGDWTHTYANPGTYTIRIVGTFPRFISNGSFFGDAEKLLSIDQWGTNAWTSFANAFYECENMNMLATDIPDLSNVTSMYTMFGNCHALVGNTSFNNWDVGNVQNMQLLFASAENFNQPLNNWNVSNVTNMYGMFNGAEVFNQDLNNWNTSQVQFMDYMFQSASDFNGAIGNWNVSNVIEMSSMFSRTEDFNQDLNSWNVSQVLEMDYMFLEATSFNGNISSWNPAQVTTMNAMFQSAINFNQDISGWNVNQVTDMGWMFRDAARFNQPIGNWNVSNVQFANEMLVGTAFSVENYDQLLIKWNQLTLQDNVSFGTDASYCSGEIAKQNIITNHSWNFTDGELNCDSFFITKWKTDNEGYSGDNQVKITTTTLISETYDYTVFWGDGTFDSNVTGDITHDYLTPGTYTVSILGTFPSITTNTPWTPGDTSDKLKLIEIVQWGSNPWTSMELAFEGCSNLDVTATDTPNLSNATSMSNMFANCDELTGTSAFANWNVGTITDMRAVFFRATLFNQDISSWNVSAVESMDYMFMRASNFNQDLGNWDISSLQIAENMFKEVTLFTNNYDNTLIGWSTDSSGVPDDGIDDIPFGITFDGGGSQYCLSESERQELRDTYGWSLTDGNLDPSCPVYILVSPKVYLQGASIDANVGEESLMRDDLRVNGLFPLSTPYSDGLTIDASILTTSGPDAIVDWVWVELRDETDNSIVIGSQSALLQRDGDVVDIDGVSPLSFDIAEDDYYIVVEHRNHLNIRSASAVALSRIVTEVDLSSDPSMVDGGANSVLLLSNGYYGMYTGDFDGNAQIQNTDANAVILLIGGSGYEDADMDINAEIQNTDVNAIISSNIGRGEQFGRPGIATERLSSDVTLAFANTQITNDGVDNYYEVDIVISGTTNFYVGSGQVYFDYNTAAFGENVATNNSIAYSQPDGTILGYSFGAFSPAYRDFVQNDNTTSRVSLSFQQNVGLAGLETAPELEVTATPKVLFHIKIRYVDNSADANICFYSEGVFQDQFFTACGGAATADCTNTPGVQITNDSYDCSEAGVDTLDITSIESEQIVLYPNPTSNGFRIKGLTTTSQIRIYDINGRLILEERSNDDRVIDMSSYANGVYFVEIKSEYGMLIKRLVKK